jgi:hypothetical protein
VRARAEGGRGEVRGAACPDFSGEGPSAAGRAGVDLAELLAVGVFAALPVVAESSSVAAIRVRKVTSAMAFSIGGGRVVDDQLPDLPEGFVIPDDMSGWLDDDDGATLTPSQSGSVQVVGDIDPDPGSPYVCTVQPSDDVSIRLPRDQAVAYGMHVLAVAHRAHYIAAVFAQMRAVMARYGVHEAEADSAAKYAVHQLVEDLPDLDDAATAPLQFRPVLTREGAPLVRVSLPPHTEPLTGWSFAETCEHAHHVLQVPLVCDLDTAYLSVIGKFFRAGEARGRAAVADLARFYEQPGTLSAAQPGKRFVVPEPKIAGPAPGVRPALRKPRKRRR